jgi:hypothetical protein
LTTPGDEVTTRWTLIAAISAAVAGAAVVLVLVPRGESAGAAAGPPASRGEHRSDEHRSEHPGRAFLPALAGSEAAAVSGSPIARHDERQVVRHVYDRFSHYTETPTGERVELALDDFRTVYRSGLDSVALYPDLATLGTDWKLVATPHVSQRPDDRARVRYQVEWLPADDLVERADTAVFLGKPADEMTALAARRLGDDRARTLAITSYRVTATFDGQSETYRAAFRWFPGEDGAMRFAILDAVVHGLSLAVVETVPAAGRGDGDAETAPPAAAPPPDAAAPACVPRTWPSVAAEPKRLDDERDHLSGDHGALFAVAVVCSCDAACVSHCEPRVTTARCEEAGRLAEPGVVHRVQGRAAAQTVSAARGDQEAAKCLAALDCYVERCVGIECGAVDVGSRAAEPGLGFSLSIDLVASMRAENDFSCGRCAMR